MWIDVYRNHSWERAATVDDKLVPLDVATNFALHIGDYTDAQNVAIIDENTGEVLWDYAEHIKLPIEDYFPEPFYADDEMGFNPYIGGYDFDC